MPAPTHEAYDELQQAFNHFNDALFDGQLAQPLITLQRERRTYGYFSRQRFIERSTGALVDEIAMNPAYFVIRSIPQTLSTLAHEMVHQWQMHHGKPGRGGYHNTEWASKMESIGLMPSNTGEPGGKRTGDQMTHYIIEGGRFDLACQQLLTTEYTLSWLDRYPAERPKAPRPPVGVRTLGGDDGDDEGTEGGEYPGGDLGGVDLVDVPGVVLPPEEPVNKSNRNAYVCPECSGKAWGKPGMILLCGGKAIRRRGKEPEMITHEPRQMLPAT